MGEMQSGSPGRVLGRGHSAQLPWYLPEATQRAAVAQGLPTSTQGRISLSQPSTSGSSALDLLGAK